MKDEGTIQFTFTNNSLTPQTLILFASGIVLNAGIPPSVDVSGSVDYDFFAQMIREYPVVVDKIEYSPESVADLPQTVLWKKFDANGLEAIEYDLLLNYVSANQVQFNGTTAYYENLILNGWTTMEFVLNPSATFTIVMYYEQYKTIQKLYQKPISIFDGLESYVIPNTKYGETELMKRESQVSRQIRNYLFKNINF